MTTPDFLKVELHAAAAEDVDSSDCSIVEALMMNSSSKLPYEAGNYKVSHSRRSLKHKVVVLPQFQNKYYIVDHNKILAP